jgi:hypothetical protein
MEWSSMTHEELLKVIKTSIEQLAKDNRVPQRQIIRELKEIHEYVGSAIPVIDDETAERNQ